MRARLVMSPEQWRWSSVRGRVSGSGDGLVNAEKPAGLGEVGDWMEFLAEGLSDEELVRVRTYVRAGKVLGSEAFLKLIEVQTGRRLHRRPRGRPPKDESRESASPASFTPLF